MDHLKNSSDSLPICPICCDLLGRYGGPSTLPCGHNGCLDCFAHVQSRNPYCPLCRAPFDPQQQLACNHELKDLINMATSVYMDDKTKEEGWEAFPTAKLMAAHYASEVKAQQRSQPLNRLIQQQLAGQLAGQQLAADASGAADAAYPSALDMASSFCSNPIIHANLTAGAQAYKDGNSGSASASGSRQLTNYQEQRLAHPGLPQSAPSGTQRDILLMEPPQWLPDSYASHCGSCQLDFKPLLRMRHHCRLCGKIFCHSCSSKQLLLPPKFKERDPQRVCGMCASLLEPLQPFLVGATAASVQPPVHDALDAISLRSWLNSPWTASMADELYKGANIVRKFNEAIRLEPERGLPTSLLAGAKGLALLSVVRLGAGWACTAGTGVVLSRQRSGTWSAPCAAACYGIGWGLQLGGELTDVLLILRTEEAVRAFASGTAVGLGGSMSVALGPVGRQAEASVRVGGLTSRSGSVVGYSCSQGAFIGASLDGSVTSARDAVNKKFYGYPVSAWQLLIDCSVPQPPAAAMLYEALDGLMTKWENRGVLVHKKASCKAPSSSSSVAIPSRQGACSSSSSSSREHHQQQQQRQQRDEFEADDFAREVFDYGSPGDSFAASAPPAPLLGYESSSSRQAAAAAAAPAAHTPASSFSSSSRASSRPQQQQSWYSSEPELAALPSAPTAPVVLTNAATAAAVRQEEEEPQYVLEW